MKIFILAEYRKFDANLSVRVFSKYGIADQTLQRVYDDGNTYGYSDYESLLHDARTGGIETDAFFLTLVERTIDDDYNE